jgi:hypothetical protein
MGQCNRVVLNAGRAEGDESFERPIFSTEWLFGVYEQAIDSFEKQCRADRKDPTLFIPRD